MDKRKRKQAEKEETEEETEKETERGPRFKKGTIQEIFRLAWAEERNATNSIKKMVDRPPKLNDISLDLATEYLRLFTVELIHRSHQVEVLEQQAQQKSNDTHHVDGLIQVPHLRKAAPGVLLDF